MTFSVKKSFVRENPGFELAVAAHAKELTDWIAREKRVAEDAKNPSIPDVERWVSCPKPEAPNPLVASAVDENGIAIYVVEDDDPTPEQILAIKKQDLARRLLQAESEARNAVLPVNKRPLREMMASDIAAADLLRSQQVASKVEAKFREDIQKYSDRVAAIVGNGPGIVTRAAAKVGIIKDPVAEAASSVPRPELQVVDVKKEVAALRTPEENDFLEENLRIEAVDVAISRNAAQALHDIEDLTVDTVDQYQIPDLNKQA